MSKHQTSISILKNIQLIKGYNSALHCNTVRKEPSLTIVQNATGNEFQICEAFSYEYLINLRVKCNALIGEYPHIIIRWWEKIKLLTSLTLPSFHSNNIGNKE